MNNNDENNKLKWFEDMENGLDSVDTLSTDEDNNKKDIEENIIDDVIVEEESIKNIESDITADTYNQTNIDNVNNQEEVSSFNNDNVNNNVNRGIKDVLNDNYNKINLNNNQANIGQDIISELNNTEYRKKCKAPLILIPLLVLIGIILFVTRIMPTIKVANVINDVKISAATSSLRAAISTIKNFELANSTLGNTLVKGNVISCNDEKECNKMSGSYGMTKLYLIVDNNYQLEAIEGCAVVNDIVLTIEKEEIKYIKGAKCDY